MTSNENLVVTYPVSTIVAERDTLMAALKLIVELSAFKDRAIEHIRNSEVNSVETPAEVEGDG